MREVSHMTTVTKADSRGRVVLRGAQDGHRYLVMRTAEGWFVQPEPTPVAARRKREWAGPRLDLGEHLEALAAEGLTLEPQMGRKIGPCRF
jgi:hypothetical protein